MDLHPSSPPMGTRRTPVGWVIAIVASAALFMLALPALSASMPQTRAVEDGEEFPLMAGTMVAPAGWDVQLDDAASGAPTFIHDDAVVSVVDGIWIGHSQGLVDRIAEWMTSADDDVVIPTVPEEPTGTEQYLIAVREPGASADVYVIREDTTVVVVRTRIDEDASESVRADIAAMVRSVQLDAVAIPVDEAKS